MSTTLKKTKSSGPSVKKVQNKAGPSEALKVILNRETKLGNYLRLFVSTDLAAKREYVLHHPVGMHSLQDDDWVVSEVSDIPLLLQRSDDPNAQKLIALKSGWIQEQLVAEGLITLNSNGEGTYPNSGKVRSDFLKSLKEAWKKENPDGKKTNFRIGDALSLSSEQAASEESDIRAYMAVIGPVADLKFKSNHETKGGTRGDRPQVCSEWMSGKTPNELLDALVKGAIEGPSTTKTTGGDGAMDDVGVADEVIDNIIGGGHPDQWCFLDPSISAEGKAKIKPTLRTIKEDLSSNNEDEYVFIVARKERTV